MKHEQNSYCLTLPYYDDFFYEKNACNYLKFEDKQVDKLSLSMYY